MNVTQKPKAKPPAPGAQVKKFRTLARELACDDDEAAFDERLKRIATATHRERDAGRDDK